jgi:diadenosine tetraphosphate (Ap4A) HIT family hydrolase
VASIFTKIINGELPGRFVWKDDEVVAFLTINPIRPGHTLVVPRREIDHWLDLDAALYSRVTAVSHSIGLALQKAFDPTKVGMIIAGLEVPHVHVHLIPIDDLEDLSFARADRNPDPKALDRAAEKIRAALRDSGCEHVAD